MLVKHRKGHALLLLTRFTQDYVLNAVFGGSLMLAGLFSGIVVARNHKDNAMIDFNRPRNLALTVSFTAVAASIAGCRSRMVGALRQGARRSAVSATLFAASLLATGLSPQPSRADEYRLSAHDKINLRVVEWRQGEGQYKEWEALTGSYLINNGTISVPLGGEFVVEGKTTAELSKEIAEGLQKQTGIMNAPSVSVTIESYGSIYVLGDVQQPGAVAYSPSMTVLQAVSMAGGFLRKADTAFMRLERDRIASSGDLEEAELDYTRLLVRQARLEAELEGKDSFEIPAEFREDPKAAAIAKEELGFMMARSSTLRSQLATLKDIQALNEQEITTLDDKIKSQHVQIKLSTEELKGVVSLREKGLAVSSRQMSLQREVADAESKLLDLEIASVRSKQALKKAERDGEDVRSTRISEIEKDLQDVRPKLEHAKVQMRTSALLITEATTTTPAILAARENDMRPKPTFSVVREGNGGSQKLVVDANTRLRPRDTVEVVTMDAPKEVESPQIPPGN